MRVLVSGAGIAGTTLAWWLRHYGDEVTLIEREPELRIGGYIIDFWGAGFEVADRMGLLPEIQRRGYKIQEVRIVDRSGRQVSSFPVKAFERVARGRYTSLPRGDLAETIFQNIEGEVETIFGDSIQTIDESTAGVNVTFERAATRTFDLVMGADGLHSDVRRLVFGPHARFEKYLGYKVAAFTVDGYRPRDELVFVMYTEVGRQVSRFPMRGDRTMFLFIFADPDPQFPADPEEQKNVLRQRFGGSGWECSKILDALDGAEDLYFDRVSQIRMDADNGWATRGRVALVGDAASCVSFLAGQGSALAMIASYVLAVELHRAGGDYSTAFARYAKSFEPFVAKKQKAALRFAGSFAPPSKASLFLRNQIFRLMWIPWVMDLVAKRGLIDEIVLPDP